MTVKGTKTIVSMSIDTQVLRLIDLAAKDQEMSRSQVVEKTFRAILDPESDPLRGIDDLES